MVYTVARRPVASPATLSIQATVVSTCQFVIGSALEGFEGPNQRRVPEREHLREEDSGDILAGIDPVERMKHAPPGQRSRAAPTWHVVEIHERHGGVREVGLGQDVDIKADVLSQPGQDWGPHPDTASLVRVPQPPRRG